MKLAGAAMSPLAVKEGGLGMARRGGARLGMAVRARRGPAGRGLVCQAVNINTGGQYGI